MELTKQVNPSTKQLNCYQSAVALLGETLGYSHFMYHSIHLVPGTNTIYIPPYCLLHAQCTVASKLVKDILDQGVIVKSHSPWNSSLLLIPKKDDT